MTQKACCAWEARSQDSERKASGQPLAKRSEHGRKAFPKPAFVFKKQQRENNHRCRKREQHKEQERVENECGKHVLLYRFAGLDPREVSPAHTSALSLDTSIVPNRVVFKSPACCTNLLE